MTRPPAGSKYHARAIRYGVDQNQRKRKVHLGPGHGKLDQHCISGRVASGNFTESPVCISAVMPGAESRNRANLHNRADRQFSRILPRPFEMLPALHASPCTAALRFARWLAPAAMSCRSGFFANVSASVYLRQGHYRSTRYLSSCGFTPDSRTICFILLILSFSIVPNSSALPPTTSRPVSSIFSRTSGNCKTRFISSLNF